MQRKLKIFISNFPFARHDPAPLNDLVNAGFDVVVNPLGRKLTPSELVQHAADADGLLAGTEDVTSLVEINPTLKLISRIGIGLDGIPLALCRQKNIRVAYTPDAVTPAVIELTLGMMIALSRKVCKADRGLRQGEWLRPYGKRLGNSLIGIVGLGRVGTGVAKSLMTLGARILVYDIRKDAVEKKMSEWRQAGHDIRFSDPETLYRESDIITIHTPLTSHTKGMVHSGILETMKKDALIFNLSRGGIIVEDDLLNALSKGIIAGAGLDVFEVEPYKGPLLGLDNVLLTQHMGACTYDCRNEMEKQAVQSVMDFFLHNRLPREVPPEEYEYQSG